MQNLHLFHYLGAKIYKVQYIQNLQWGSDHLAIAVTSISKTR